ncbi:unnamed protein product, partial [Rotaria magnacalcarata]
HLQDFRNNDTCDKMKELIKDCKRISSITADNQQSFTCSNTTPDHESSPNAILLNSTSTSIATDDHESLEQPSPLLKRDIEMCEKLPIRMKCLKTRRGDSERMDSSKPATIPHE